jgi:hypothetical protein
MNDQLNTPATDSASSQDAQAQAPAESKPRTEDPWFRKKSYFLTLAFIVVLVTIFATFGGGWSSLTAGGGSQSDVATAPGARALGDIGTKVRDGTFEFVVTGVERPGKTLAGKLNTTLTAQGEFVIVRANVTNVGKTAQSADCQCQLLVSDQGEKFKPSPLILSTKDALKFVRRIEPGTTVKDVVVLFDVTAGTKVVNIELHDSASTSGAKVKLS